MPKVYTPNSSPDELKELIETVKFVSEHLNSSQAAKKFLQDPNTRKLTDEEFVSRLVAITQDNGNHKSDH